jgi:hypothetical protein
VAFLIVLFGCAIGASAASNVRIEFVKPENYTDVSFCSMTPESARERLIGELSRTIQDSAAKPLAGDELYVRVLDVHMAGRPAFEAPGINSDLRIRNRTTPPDFPSICDERSFREGARERRRFVNRSELPVECDLPGDR